MSLDVVLGSGLLSLAIARYWGVSLPVIVVAGLMISVWLIYTFDHLSDAKKVRQTASTYRHRFHQQHFKALKIALLGFGLLGLTVAALLPLPVLKWGVICAAAVLFYFILLKLHSFWFKELLIAACYTLGVFLGPLSLLQHELNVFQLMLIPQILLLALANLIIFSFFDYQSDQQDGHYSLAIHLGLRRSKILAAGLVVAGLVFSLLLLLLAELPVTRQVQLLVLIMNGLLFMLLIKERQFRQHELYRLVGDGIFFLPALILLYAS